MEQMAVMVKWDFQDLWEVEDQLEEGETWDLKVILNELTFKSSIILMIQQL